MGGGEEGWTGGKVMGRGRGGEEGWRVWIVKLSLELGKKE